MLNTDTDPARVVSSTATWLGRAGLLPFLALPALMELRPMSRGVWEAVLAAYAFGILAFLLGAWWGIALLKRSAVVLGLSNGLFLTALAVFLLVPNTTFFLAAAAIFILILLTEKRYPLFAPQPRYYARLRTQLSAVASVALLAACLSSYTSR